MQKEVNNMDPIVDKPTITRRMFLKTTALTAAILAASKTFIGKSEPAFVKRAHAAEKEVVKYGNCAGCQQGDCQTIYRMVNGVVVEVEGDPGSPISKGMLCARGKAAIMNLYNPYRVKTPLKRTNPEKGINVDPKWMEISWDEALNTCAEKLRACREKDPRGLIVNESFGSKETRLRTPFQRSSGTPNMVGSHGPTCSVHYASNIVQGGGPVSTPDLTYTDYHITQGRTCGPNFSVPPASRRLITALERGMKFIDIDPRNSEEGSKGEWVPIRPGMDLAFNLAMANVMMNEIGKIDEWFLKIRTNAPYLIQKDRNYVRDPETNKPLMWNLETNQAVPFDDPDTDNLALEGEYTVNGIVCHPAYHLIKNEFKQYTPEWQEQFTTVPAAKVREIANDFVNAARIGSTIELEGTILPYRPVSFNNERGTADHKGGTYADLVTKIINMLVGAIEVPGSCLSNTARGPRALEPMEDGTVTPRGEAAGVPWVFPPDHVDMSEFYPNKHTGPHLTVKAILDPKTYYLSYDIDVWFGCGGNSIDSCGGSEQFIEAYKKIPFVFIMAYHFDAPTMLADIVLPEHSYMERLFVRTPSRPHQNISDEVNGLQMLFARDPVPTLYNTMHCDDIYIELADRAGFLKGPGGLLETYNKNLDLNRKYTMEELYEIYVQEYDPNLTLDELKKKGNVQKWVDKKLGYNYIYWPDNTTRHPFYFIHLKEVADTLKANLAKDGVRIPGWEDQDDFFFWWDPIPHWKPNTNTYPDGDLDMFAINWKTPFYANGVGAPHDNVWLEDIIRHSAPYHAKIWINTKTAAAKGIKDGDMIVVENRAGKTQGEALLTEMIHPEVVGFPGMRGSGTLLQNPMMRKGPYYNDLVSMEDNTFDPVNGSLDVSPRVKVYKA
jgi:anaerobic selenocysteine-containing dehydrogenase